MLMASFGFTAGTYSELPRMPWPAGCEPVASEVELILVTVGKTAWLSMQWTPLWVSPQRFGVSSGEIKSGRMPSQTMTMARLAALTLWTPSTLTLTPALSQREREQIGDAPCAPSPRERGLG